MNSLSKALVVIVTLTFLAVLAIFAQTDIDPQTEESKVSQTQESKNNDQKSEKPTNPGKVKNVILMIGDGMGLGQVSQAVMYRKLRLSPDKRLNLEKISEDHHTGMVTTYTFGDIVTDSASAATAMACGIKTLSEIVGLNPEGFLCETVLEKAIKLGKATGLVSTTRLSHATPAAFAGHQSSRHLENEIAVDHIEKHDIDVFLNGGIRHLIPQYKDEDAKIPMKASDISECAGLDPELDGKSKRKDQINLVDVAKKKGYNFVCSSQQLSSLELKADTKVLGLFSSSVFPMIQERSKISSMPSLPLMTSKAIELLDKKPNGFFLMVEGGLIDYAGHDNDAGTMLQETLDFDKAVGVALKYVESHPDTLLIVTADHETGGFGFSYARGPEQEKTLPSGLVHQQKFIFAPHDKFDLLINQKKSYRAIINPIIEKLYPEEGTGINMAEAVQLLRKEISKETAYELNDLELAYVLQRKPGAKDYEPADFKDFYYYFPIHLDGLGRAVSKQTNTVWGTGTHTATPVGVFAAGPEEYANKVEGLIDNTDISKIISAAFDHTAPKIGGPIRIQQKVQNKVASQGGHTHD